jgi:hypothetical protein
MNHPSIQALFEKDSAGRRGRDSSSYLLGPERNYIYEFSHLMLESSWGDRVRLLRGALFPPLRELEDRYDTRNRAKIPFIYLYRIMFKLPETLIFGRKGNRAEQK